MEKEREYAPSEDDDLRNDPFIRHELAHSGIARMIGHTATDILREEKKENPNLELIEELERKSSQYISDQDKIYQGNEEVIDKVLFEYLPLLKKRFEEYVSEHKNENSDKGSNNDG